MDFNNILISGVSLGAMGLVFGAGLAYASQKFAVEIDPKAVAIRDALPGANCGGCGYPGCDGFANAVVKGEAPVDGCPVGGSDCATLVAKIMGVSAEGKVKQVARVLCKGGKDTCTDKYVYDGFEDCRAANMLLGGSKSCEYGCMGLGSCVAVCPFDAIHINEEGLAEVEPDKCTACGKCIEVCPKDVIAYVPYEQLTVVDCNNKERGAHVKKNCNVACIACGICERSCPFDAIHVENLLAVIDYDKCTNCMICAEKCPTGSITADFNLRKTAEIIEEKCIGCTLCTKVCPVDAIEGKLKEVHKIDPEKCIGCGKCEEKCPKDAIFMK
ncbi:RnfABCDGE type electron transport complex subunit B [Helicovermis profundi]|uniref:Ion-translocating oxidoreductase complex subunit B n=1 Tax=Helicovermis profundi TaxID=3065157 RepID=A0AAU9E5L4_9FIRM|nr:RnfABCDGE type electron transport complex subunit B [Clostridia bacterium S502]